MNKKILLILFLFYSSIAKSQSSQQLENQRQVLIEEIEASRKKLEELRNSKSSVITKINALEYQIEKQKELTKTLKKEIELSPQQDSLIKDTKLLIDYKSLYQSLVDNPENFSDTIAENQKDSFLIRSVFLRQLKNFSETEKPQPKRVNTKSKEEILQDEINILDQLYMEIDSLTDLAKLDSRSQESMEDKLKRQISRREQLNKKIKDFLLDSQSQGWVNSLTTNSSIEDQKGFLQYPLSEASIYLRYGEQKHPKNKKLVIVNSGLDLESASGQVRSIFDGEVINVGKASRNESTIIISHNGGYFSVYSNMSKLNVKKGDLVSKGQNIGLCKKSTGQDYMLHFEFWKGRKNLNPYHWLHNN